MPVVRIPIEDTEWLTVEGAAAVHGVGERAVQRWITNGLLPALQIGEGRPVYLLRRRDVEQFAPTPRGRPKND